MSIIISSDYINNSNAIRAQGGTGVKAEVSYFSQVEDVLFSVRFFCKYHSFCL